MIVITTPTGAIGSELVEHLLEAGAPLRLIARDPSKLSLDIRERVEVVQGSHSDSEVLDRALIGADALFWLVPPNSGAESPEAAYVDFSRPASEAIRKHGVGRVVSVSALGRGTPWERRAGLVSASLAADDLLASTGAAFRALAMPSFMDNLLGDADAIREEGTFSGPLDPDRKHPTCATADIVSAAARLLLDDTWSGQGHIAVLGPEDLSPNDMAGIMTEVLGRLVTYHQVSFEEFGDQMRGYGMSEAFVQGFVDMMKAKDEGMDDAEPRTVENTTPTSFRTWCETVLKPALSSGA